MTDTFGRLPNEVVDKILCLHQTPKFDFVVVNKEGQCSIAYLTLEIYSTVIHLKLMHTTEFNPCTFEFIYGCKERIRDKFKWTYCDDRIITDGSKNTINNIIKVLDDNTSKSLHFVFYFEIKDGMIRIKGDSVDISVLSTVDSRLSLKNALIKCRDFLWQV